MNAKVKAKIRWGLCCQFRDVPIKYRTTTAAALAKSEKPLEKISELVLENLKALLSSIEYCHHHNIGNFRINSQFLPLYTHPNLGYTLEKLPNASTIFAEFERIKKFAAHCHVRLVFHPDQFVVLNSPIEKVVEASLAELEYHGLLAELLGADVINIHGGGVYGDKKSACLRFIQNFEKLSPRVQALLTVENDDRSYSPEDLLPLCKAVGIPLVYDVHHHRCLPDGLDIEAATKAALSTWNREPLFHISSPINGWRGSNPRSHHDFIDPADFPSYWLTIGPFTLEVEAKAKECAVHKLQEAISKM